MAFSRKSPLAWELDVDPILAFQRRFLQKQLTAGNLSNLQLQQPALKKPSGFCILQNQHRLV